MDLKTRGVVMGRGVTEGILMASEGGVPPRAAAWVVVGLDRLCCSLAGTRGSRKGTLWEGERVKDSVIYLKEAPESRPSFCGSSKRV